MTESYQLLRQARDLLQEEVRQLQETIESKQAKLDQLNRLVHGSATPSPKLTISEVIIQILQGSPTPLSAKEICSKVREMGVRQKATNPHNSILALLHHLKKHPDSQVCQDQDKRWYWKGAASDHQSPTDAND